LVVALNNVQGPLVISRLQVCGISVYIWIPYNAASDLDLCCRSSPWRDCLCQSQRSGVHHF